MAYMMAMQGAAKLTVDDVLRFVFPVDVAVNNARSGTIDKQGWQSIFNAINMLEELIRMRVCNDEDNMIDDLQQTVIAILERARSKGTKALYPDEITALMDLRAVYADVLAGLTHSQYYDAEASVERRLRRVLGQKPPKGVHIIEES
jgi:hypothetical protein